MARDNLTRGFLITASALLIALVATHGLAAQDRDGRWSPWVGCWEPVAENTAPSLLCVRPAEGGVDVSEIAEGAVRSAQNLQADGESYDNRGRRVRRYAHSRIFDGRKAHLHPHETGVRRGRAAHFHGPHGDVVGQSMDRCAGSGR